MWKHSEGAPGRARGAGWLAALLPLVVLPAAAPDPPDPRVPAEAASFCEAEAVATNRVRIPDPFGIQLAPTPNANGASGAVRLTFAQSPFGVTVTEDGTHRYRVSMSTRGLKAAPGTALVAWAVTPSLDEVERLGALGADGALVGEVAFNKFLVFITAEPSADVERWSGPILLRGISRSGRMHTMLGHGPFEGAAC